MSDDRIKLLYIASTGRAGSTILEMMLNAHSRCWTLGEFDILSWEVRTNTKPCGCGTAIAACPFWGPIIETHRKTILDGTLTRLKLSHQADRTIRFLELPFVLSGKPALGPKRSQSIQRYADDNEEVLRAVRASATALRSQPVEWLIDASKSPYRLLWLAASGRFDIRVIHLIKDPRAFAYSMSKREQGLGRAYWAMRSSLRWHVQNRLFDAVIRNYLSPRHALRVRYEDLAADAESTMRQIGDWLEIPFESGAAAHFRDGNHGVAGNPARAESKPIELDDKWKRELPPPLAKAGLLINGRLAKRYGYKP